MMMMLMMVWLRLSFILLSLDGQVLEWSPLHVDLCHSFVCYTIFPFPSFLNQGLRLCVCVLVETYEFERAWVVVYWGVQHLIARWPLRHRENDWYPGPSASLLFSFFVHVSFPPLTLPPWQAPFCLEYVSTINMPTPKAMMGEEGTIKDTPPAPPNLARQARVDAASS